MPTTTDPTTASAEIDEAAEIIRMVADTAWSAKDWVAARRAYAVLVDCNPYDADVLNRLGRLHLMKGELDQAVEQFSESFRIKEDPATCINLAVTQGRRGNFRMALYWCSRSLVLDPAFLPAFIHQASIYEEMGQLQDATFTVKRGLELHPTDPQLLYAAGVHALMRGDFERGWENYEYRINRLNLCEKLDEYPEWKGEPLAGKTILVCWEQGYGDQIMWARYLPLLECSGATHVVLFTRPELARLLHHSFPTVTIATTDLELTVIEPDYWVAMGSLPLRCAGNASIRDGKSWSRGGVPDGFNTRGPYLAALPADIDRFQSLAPADGKLRVGLCWAGNPEHFRDRYRSMTWEGMRPLLDDRITFYSLQRGGQDSGLPSLVDYCHDLADTAAAIATIDLVISVDTVILHLAAAMGKLVIGIVPTEWRWGGETKDPCRPTPWYSSVLLFPRSQGISEAILSILSKLVNSNTSASIIPASEYSVVDPIVTRVTRYATLSWYRNDTYIGRALDLYGEYSQAEAKLLTSVLNPGDTVVEAGANIGALTVAMAHRVGKDGAVLAFEPQPLYANLLRKNLSGTAFAFALALGAEAKDITLRHVHTDRIHAPGWASKGEEFQVEQVTVDALNLERLNLLKIDVDGQELEILRGAEKTILRCRPMIYVENDKPDEYPDLMPWLIAHGYRLYQHYAPLFNPANFAHNEVNVFGSMVSAMLLCVPNERKDIRPGEWGLQRIREETVAV